MEEDLIFGTGFFGLDEDNLTQKRKLQLREGELREVTVLFADIKGFTNLSSRLDPEVIHARMDELLKVFFPLRHLLRRLCGQIHRRRHHGPLWGQKSQ